MKIHQIWYQGVDKAPKKYDDNRLSWLLNHPEAEFCTWDYAKASALVHRHYPEWEAFFESLPLMIQQIDVMKVFILHHEGGVYADMDSTSLRPLDNWITGFPGLTVSRMHTKWMEHLAIGLLKGYENRRMLNNGILIAPEPRHPFWIYYLERLRLEMDRERTWLERLVGNNSLYVMNTTGPLFWTECVNAWRRNHPDSIRILHYSFLEPIFGMDPPERQVPRTWSYVKHQHASSWCQNELGLIRAYYHWVRPWWKAWGLLLVILVSLFIGRQYTN